MYTIRTYLRKLYKIYVYNVHCNAPNILQHIIYVEIYCMYSKYIRTCTVRMYVHKTVYIHFTNIIFTIHMYVCI